VRRVALRHLDEVRDQVVASLELVLDLRPGGVDLLLHRHHLVVAAAGRRRDQDQERHRAPHVASLPAAACAAATEAAAAEPAEATATAAEAAVTEPAAAEPAEAERGEPAATEAGRMDRLIYHERDHEHGDQEDRPAGQRGARGRALAWRRDAGQLDTVRRGDPARDLGDPLPDALVDPPGPERGDDCLVLDLSDEAVGEDAFEPVADDDPDLPVVRRDQEHDTRVLALPSG